MWQFSINKVHFLNFELDYRKYKKKYQKGFSIQVGIFKIISYVWNQGVAHNNHFFF